MKNEEGERAKSVVEKYETVKLKEGIHDELQVEKEGIGSLNRSFEILSQKDLVRERIKNIYLKKRIKIIKYPPSKPTGLEPHSPVNVSNQGKKLLKNNEDTEGKGGEDRKKKNHIKMEGANELAQMKANINAYEKILNDQELLLADKPQYNKIKHQISNYQFFIIYTSYFTSKSKSTSRS